MKDHHTSQQLHAMLADTNTTRDCHDKQPHRRYIPKIFKDLWNVFGSADDILVLGYDAHGKDHDDALQRVLQKCRQVNLKISRENDISNANQSHFWWGHILAWCEIWPTKVKRTNGDAPSKTRKKFYAFFGIINFLSIISPSIADICESLRQLILSKSECTCNTTSRSYLTRQNQL